MITRAASFLKAEWVGDRLKVGHVVLFVAAVCLSLVAISIWGVFSSLEDRLTDKEIEMSNLSKALSSSIAATLTQADTVILGIQGQVEVDGTGGQALSKLRHVLKNQKLSLPQVDGFSIYDEQGDILFNSAGVTALNLNSSDRDYFIYHRDHPGSAAFIGPSIRSRATGEWVMTVSRRLNHADGSFAGVAVATIYLKYLLSLYDGIDVGDNGLINLTTSAGHIIVRKPFIETAIGTDISTGEVFALLKPGVSSGTASIRSFIDHVERVISFQRVHGYPLVIIVAFDRNQVLADWRRESFASFLVASVLLLVFSFLGYRLIRLMSQQIEAQKELQRSETSYKEANRALGQLALEDGLTGLPNRRKFDLFISAQINKAARRSGDVALIMIDVDFFKKYNDCYGHVQGDECLRTVGAIIKKHVTREGDLAARYGGEEFAIVLSNTDYVGAFILAERIRTELESLSIEHREVPAQIVTLSAGVGALSGSEADTAEHLIAIADKALYVAKSSGRNRTVISNHLSEVQA